MNTSKKNGKDTSGGKGTDTKRPRFRIGPGLLIALLLAVVVGGRAIKSEMDRRQANSAPPIIERQVVSSGQDKLGPVPEIQFLIDRQKKLGLSQDQLGRLSKLQSGWRSFYAPKMKEADRAAKQVADYMSRSKANRRTPVAQIQKAAAPVVAVSGEISAQRRHYWDDAMQILTAEQRKLAAHEREADYQARLKALAEAVKNR